MISNIFRILESLQNRLSETAGFRYYTVNHRYNFVNSRTQIHTQLIERLWITIQAKRNIKGHDPPSPGIKLSRIPLKKCFRHYTENNFRHLAV